jgi:hypothetical protein
VRVQRLVQVVWCVTASFAVLALAPCCRAQSASRLDVRLVTDEADAVLSILAKTKSNEAVTGADWERLFSSEGYVRLKAREASLHRDFTDTEFKTFVISLLPERADALAKTLAAWKRADLNAAAQRALTYLPVATRIRAKVFPVIKPRQNSFVWEAATDPAIFLYLDPDINQAQFDNTVAHEMHHIGLTTAQAAYEKIVAAAPEQTRPVLNWIGAFGEGEAVLAAAGSPNIHPISAFKNEDRIRWDQDVSGFASNLVLLDQFFGDILRGGFADKQTIQHVAMSFFGYRGPWYTVGYKMATLVEKYFGRAAVIGCMEDPRRLLLRYNEAATAERKQTGEPVPLWSPEVVRALGGVAEAGKP